ncbi:MAG: carboxypeptidase-like regulatory domain-containing protein [Armatimonadota bacterium]
MKASILTAIACAGLALALFAGCGTTTGGTGTGYGADAGPWPSGPSRTAATPTNQAEQAPPSALAVMLRGKTAENQTLELEVTQVDLKFGDQWVPVANREAIAKIEALPLRIGAKGSTAMLAAPKTKVPKRKYTHLRLRFDDRKTKLVAGDKKLPLTLQATLELGEWTPDEKALNTLTVTLDGTKVTDTKSSATLPPAALTVAKTTTAAGLSGKLVPPLPTARVDVFWGNTKFVLGTAAPNAQDGSFQIGNLPAGAYRLEVVNPGYHRAETPKELLQLEDKAVSLGEIQMVKNE